MNKNKIITHCVKTALKELHINGRCELWITSVHEESRFVILYDKEDRKNFDYPKLKELIYNKIEESKLSIIIDIVYANYKDVQMNFLNKNKYEKHKLCIVPSCGKRLKSGNYVWINTQPISYFTKVLRVNQENNCFEWDGGWGCISELQRNTRKRSKIKYMLNY
jgi:hypothetical protein